MHVNAILKRGLTALVSVRTLGVVWALACSCAALGASGWFASAQAKGPLVQDIAASTIALAELPKQGQETYVLIFKGGPFAYDKDGTVFGNRERVLPAQKRGYYREYTVKTPYARTRGAKRIVCGGSQPEAPEACFYSDDHYASFKRIVK